ncbi:MAG: FAD-binding oxidoreductase [Leptolyngbyaceae cyanobacterium SM1_4_3]|nr:FAD-binding oxidoreductase [Leptolyngbyaceae cyanobacterium SM1_4_3]
MKTYDWIVVGGGVAGAALSYELANRTLSVLRLEQDAAPENATRYSYGGIAYWSGTTPLTRQLCQEGIEIHRNLSAELDSDTQFRELDLLLPIAQGSDPETVAASYRGFAVPPSLLDADAACELEPLLNREAIAAALTVRHGSVSPDLLVKAYTQAFTRAGGTVEIAQVTALVDSQGQGTVTTTAESYTAANVVVCAGSMSRSLLKTANVTVPCYFTHAELIETEPVALKLRSLVMPAETQRFQMEAEAGKSEKVPLWDQQTEEVAPPVLDPGAIQFIDGRIRIGQISRTLANPQAQIDAAQSEADIRAAVGQFLPALRDVPGTWHRCLVAFSGDRLPLIGTVPDHNHLHIFAGFSNPFAILPPLAKRFANHASGEPDDLIAQLALGRFA